MEHISSELLRLFTKLNKSLLAMMSTVLALCKETDHQKRRINISNNSSGPPVAQFDGITTKAEQTLPQKAHTLHQAEQAEKAFCTTHNLIDKNINPNPMVSALMIAICVFVDAAVNSSFLYNAHMVSGPFAALLVSFLISLTNVVLSVCGGYFIGRYLNYGSNSADADAPEFKKIRVRARRLFRVFIGAMGFFILTVGLVRSTESLDRIGHTLTHYHELIVTPEAVFLVLLNICIAVFSYHKGRTGFIHPYGDYSIYQSSVAAASEDLYETYGDLVEEIEDVCAAVEDDGETQESAQSKPIKQYNNKVTQCHQAYRELEQAARDAESEFSATLTRTINTHSVLTGKKIAVPNGLFDQFAFVDVSTIKLPEYYQPSQRNKNNPALAKAKAAALKRLSDIFKRALQN
jgi:hypothetical protein